MLIASAVSTPNLHNKEPAIDWHAPDFQEFVPESFGGPMVSTRSPFSAIIRLMSPARVQQFRIVLDI